MDKQMKKPPAFQLGKEIGKNEQKKVMGGGYYYCAGTRCRNYSFIGCTTANLSGGYCGMVGVIETCNYAICYQ
jgi:hypothetical protein